MTGAATAGARALATVLAAAVLLAVAVAGTARAAEPTVYAAASLTEALPQITPAARYSFAGSDTLALQIRRGAPADVFASAAPDLTRDLHRDGLVEAPRPLAYNRLVVVVPRSNPAGIDSVYDLGRDGVAVVLADTSVPVGAYSRAALTDLGLTRALDNVVSREPDVRDVLGKVALGQADAGLVYSTDARVAGSRVTALPIPAFAQPEIRYEIAVVASGGDRPEARDLVARATGPAGRAVLARAGFLLQPPAAPPPRRSLTRDVIGW